MPEVVLVFIVILIILLPCYVRILSRNAAKGKIDAHEMSIKQNIKEMKNGKSK